MANSEPDINRSDDRQAVRQVGGFLLMPNTAGRSLEELETENYGEFYATTEAESGA